MELDYKEIGKRVKIARIRADLTQEALAEKAGLSITHMSNIENGHSKLSLPMAVALATAFGGLRRLRDTHTHRSAQSSQRHDPQGYEAETAGIAQAVIVDRTALLFSYNAKRRARGLYGLCVRRCFFAFMPAPSGNSAGLPTVS